MFDKVLFSSANDNWSTPENIFKPLNDEFGFTLDPCCQVHTAKCDKFFTKTEDGLLQSWRGEIVFMNPPYGRQIRSWMKKAYDEARAGSTVVCLVPARTDTKWWHDFCMKSSEVRLYDRRISFLAANDNALLGAKANATFPNALVIFRPNSTDKLLLGVQHV